MFLYVLKTHAYNVRKRKKCYIIKTCSLNKLVIGFYAVTALNQYFIIWFWQ